MTKPFVATQVDKSDNSRGTWFSFVKAFTLAEVLITLGIIGVVAAMTIPTLVKNYQKTVWVNQLKKSVSTLEQGFQKMMADDGVDNLLYTSIFNRNGSRCCETGDSKKAFCDSFWQDMTKYFKIFDGRKDPDDAYLPVFADGTTIFYYEIHFGGDQEDFDYSEYCNEIKALGGTLCSYVAQNFQIDVNGKKGPNVLGRDIFSFLIGTNGKLYPYNGKDYALMYERTPLASNTRYWKNATYGNCSPDNLNRTGNGCAARIIENGWKMDY